MWTKALSLTLAMLALPAMAETRLIMAEEEGCVWCAPLERRNWPYLSQNPGRPRRAAVALGSA
jgi:hypothetical protein